MNSSPGVDYKRVANLINSILCLEYCLQYEIVPLNLERGCLSLGMVNPKDTMAVDFVRTITNALGYSLATQAIDSNLHQLALAEYLKYNHTKTLTDKNTNSKTSVRKEVDDLAMTLVSSPLESQSNTQQHNLNDKATLIAHPSEKSLGISTPASEDTMSTVTDLTLHQRSTLCQETKVQAKSSDKSDRQTQDLELDRFNDFDIASPSIDDDLNPKLLQTLTPQELWQKFFTKILDGSIQKLHLTRNEKQGRIIWSPDEIAQFSFDNVSLSTIQTLIAEIKTLAKIPLGRLEKTKKVAIEKHYQQERLQLRIDACPSQWGDEITIQVLRGDALKLYEQQKIQKMSKQALSLAQKLAKTLDKMHSYFEPSAIKELNEIQQVKQEIERQLLLLDRL